MHAPCEIGGQFEVRQSRESVRLKFFDQPSGAKSDGFSDLQELDHVYSPLTAFDIRDDGLITPQFFGDLGLRKTCSLPLRNEQRDQLLLPS